MIKWCQILLDTPTVSNVKGDVYRLDLAAEIIEFSPASQTTGKCLRMGHKHFIIIY